MPANPGNSPTERMLRVIAEHDEFAAWAQALFDCVPDAPAAPPCNSIVEERVRLRLSRHRNAALKDYKQSLRRLGAENKQGLRDYAARDRASADIPLPTFDPAAAEVTFSGERPAHMRPKGSPVHVPMADRSHWTPDQHAAQVEAEAYEREAQAKVEALAGNLFDTKD